MLALLAVVALVVVLVLYVIGIYNRLVRLRNMTEEGFSGIDVQLKKRADLIPNLLETVKGYMQHERQVLENVTQYRAQAAGAAQAGDREAQARSEGMLSQALGRLFAVAENYPDLKANQNFLELQSALALVENDLQNARRYYNGVVRELNIKVESFPSNLVAQRFGFAKAEFFEIEDAADRAVPKVSF